MSRPRWTLPYVADWSPEERAGALRVVAGWAVAHADEVRAGWRREWVRWWRELDVAWGGDVVARAHEVRMDERGVFVDTREPVLSLVYQVGRAHACPDDQPRPLYLTGPAGDAQRRLAFLWLVQEQQRDAERAAHEPRRHR